jgi:hypothetical protein
LPCFALFIAAYCGSRREHPLTLPVIGARRNPAARHWKGR